MRVVHRLLLVGLLASGLAAPAQAQRILGTWRARTPDDTWATVVVRADSSASLGDQTVRWRVVGDSLWLALGDGTWSVYGMRVHSGARRLTVSGGDLEEPITLERVGPPSPRPPGAEIPAAPPDTARAIP
ncbi:MAG: hypothetical protein ACREN5_05945 [Gemmatimonadales bacterium]